MGVIDTGKMIMKARKAQKQMRATQAAGTSKSKQTAILINGLGEIEEVSFDFPEEVVDRVGQDFLDSLEQEIIESYSAAKKQLETILSQNMDADSIKDMLGL